MSDVEIRQREGMPYGGMPHDILLEKLEETDLEPEVDYDSYVRSEIIDRAPDAPFLESDHARRDASSSKSILHLRYNGTRGSRPELPRHPEMFYGFTGNDPRGVDNVPRFDEMRGQMTSRAVDVTTSMGNNDDFSLAERPWTGQSISYGMKEIHKRLKSNIHIFATQKQGLNLGRNISINPNIQLDQKKELLEHGNEGFHISASDSSTLISGGYIEQDTSIWNDADYDMSFHNQQDGMQRRNKQLGNTKSAKINTIVQDLTESKMNAIRSNNIKKLMLQAVKTQKHDQLLKNEQNSMISKGIINKTTGLIHRSIEQDQLKKESLINSISKLSQSRNVEKVSKMTHINIQHDSTNNTQSTTKLPEKFSSIQHVRADGSRNFVADYILTKKSGTQKISNISKHSKIQLTTDGKEVNVYKGSTPSQEDKLSHSKQDSSFKFEEATQVQKNKMPQWVSNTQGQSDIDTSNFGSAEDTKGIISGGASHGSKRLRAGDWNKSEEFKEF